MAVSFGSSCIILLSGILLQANLGQGRRNVELGRGDVTGKFISCDLPDLELLRCSGRPGRRAASVARISPIVSSFFSIFFFPSPLSENARGESVICAREHGGFFFHRRLFGSGVQF